LEFFFSKSFYRGRKDEISDVFQQRALETIKEFDLKKNIGKFSSSSFTNLLQKNGVNNNMDRRMVCETIQLVKGDANKNIVSYSINKIKKGEVGEIYEELCNIYGIADKIACFFLRDVSITFNLDKMIDEEDYKYFQPIDTWVNQTSSKLGIIGPEYNNVQEIKSKIINSCLNNKVSPLLFNAGAWYVGKHAFDIFFEEPFR